MARACWGLPILAAGVPGFSLGVALELVVSALGPVVAWVTPSWV